LGGARPAVHGRMKVGFSKEGRVTALDMYTVVDGGPYGPGGDGNTASRFASLMFQPEAIRWRGVTAITNTPPRRAQSQPGGMQGITLMEPLLAKAARALGVDQVAIHRINAPEGKAVFAPRSSNRRSIAARSHFDGTRAKPRAENAMDRRCAGTASPRARSSQVRKATTACSSSSPMGVCTFSRALGISALNR